MGKVNQKKACHFIKKKIIIIVKLNNCMSLLVLPLKCYHRHLLNMEVRKGNPVFLIVFIMWCLKFVVPKVGMFKKI